MALETNDCEGTRPSGVGASVRMTGRLSLAPEARSVSEARRWVGQQLAGPAAEVAALLVSELVTNAVLHTGTPVEVGVDLVSGGIRIEVADSSPVLPSAKNYSPDAGTGRGLLLVDALASSWGVVPSTTGKVVWFTLTEPGNGPVSHSPAALSGSPAAPDSSGRPGPDPDSWHDCAAAPPDLVPIRLLGVPTSILRRASEQYDGLFREFRLIIERDPAAGKAVPGRLLELADELAIRFSGFTGATDGEFQRARAGQCEAVDIEYRLPVEAGAASSSYDQLLDEADAYCRAGRELLTIAPSAEAVALRKWLLGEFVHQATGDEPVAWPQSVWAQALLFDDNDPGRDHGGTNRS